MKSALTPGLVDSIMAELQEANSIFDQDHPGESMERQPVHTVYGGAHLFKAESVRRIGDVALDHLTEHAPNFIEFARALGLKGHSDLPETESEIGNMEKHIDADPDTRLKSSPQVYSAYIIHKRVIAKLKVEPVEDFRIDFEDGYGDRPDEEEDAHAVAAAREVARGMASDSLPPFIGIRIKPLTEESKRRAVRTLDLFVQTLAEETDGKLPENFVVTLPKVTVPEHVSALVRLFEILESHTPLPPASLKLELMVETPQSILGSDGSSALPSLVGAAQGRCVAAHFGVYDYTAFTGITAAYQGMTHPACDFARHIMKVALAGTGVRLSDGATNIMPLGHRREVHKAWKLNFDDIRHSLRHGYYQGWDLHPSQLPVRYAAVYSFFLESLEAASLRLKTFIEGAAKATLVGNIFDDAATGQALLNYFLRGISCGAFTDDELKATGLTLEEIRTRSFTRILQGRQS